MTDKKQNVYLYISLFRGRTDIYAVRWEKDGRSGYMPAYKVDCEVSKATATRDLTELIDKYKLMERLGEVGAGTTYKLIGL